MANERLCLVKNHLEPANLYRLKDKVCIITGAGSIQGIGRATAFLFAIHGAKAIYVCDINDTNLESLCKELKHYALDSSFQAIPKKLDVSDEFSINSVIQDSIENFKRLDVFFANAGIATTESLYSTNSKTFMETIRINTLSVFLAIQIASKAMKLTSLLKPISNGSIIITSSIAGIRSGAGSIDYSASKAAIINMVNTSSWQLRGSNIRINAICPGLIETNMTEKVFIKAKKKNSLNKVGQLNPLLRYGIASEIAYPVLFLASDESSYVNGQAWNIDGGLSSSLPVIPGKSY